jgi:xanthine dehydrogenase accessory factor
MLVTADDLFGTVGGGKIEHRATRMARDMLVGDEIIALHDLTEVSSLGQACGGRLTLVFDRIHRANGEWLATAARTRENGARPVLVSRLDTGAKLVVTATDRQGSLGSAALDRAATEAARRADRTTWLDAHDGVKLFIDSIFSGGEIDLVLFGAGHVGTAIARVLGSHPDLRITWVDDRPELVPDETPPDLRVIATEDPADQVRDMPAGAFVVIVSHSHAFDYAIAENVLRRGDFRYCGLIGSAGKRAQFEKRWLGLGLPAETLGRLVCPIGVQGISGRQPADIAIAVAAEILRVRDALEADSDE